MMNIEKIAAQVGFYVAYENREVTDKELEAFANAIVEECAKVCEVLIKIDKSIEANTQAHECVKAIRKLKVSE